MGNIINNTYNFILFLESLINDTFIKEICEEVGELISDKICYKEKQKFDIRYSKYNYNIVKLRTGIYYSKTLIENIDTLFDDFNFHNIINVNKINNYDELLNDKNILYIYNKTNFKLFGINKESISLIDESFQYFLEDIKTKYTYKNEYLPFFNKFKEIITYFNNDYNNNISLKNNITKDNINSLLNEFNDTLFSQLSIRDNYDYYNFNETYFTKMNSYFKSSIRNIFKISKNNITNLKNNYNFNNSMKAILHKLQYKKREYFKNIINNFSKNYDFNLLNMTYDLGEYLKLFMEKEYDDYEFTFIYDYVALFERQTYPYINKIIEDITIIETQTLEKYENIYNNFYNEILYNASNFISINYINSLKYNYSKCLNYSLNLFNKKNLVNDDKYTNITLNIDYIFSNCSINKNIENKYLNLKLSDKIDFILNISNNCYDFLYEVINNSYFNETLEAIECFNNQFYNYTIIYLNNFNDSYQTQLENIINKLDIQVNYNTIDENFLIDFLDKNYKLEPYEGVELSDISYNYEDIESMINYINNKKNDEYKNYLFDLLISSFNSSYTNLVNNFIINELIDDFIIPVNYKLEIHLDYMLRKIQDEYNYYLLILNSTDELGYSSKLALINLYKNINKQLNETIFYLVEDDIYFYLQLFYRENKQLFRNTFLTFYSENLNKYGIKVFKLQDFFDEIILDQKFNKTIDSITKNLMNDIIIGNIKEIINKSLYFKIENLYNISELFAYNIEEILKTKNTKILPLDMNNINNLIINYTKLVNSQNNRYFLNISERPFNILSLFIHDNLEPPLILIKYQYNTIEERLLHEIIKIINSFPNYYLIVRDKLDLEYIQENISYYIDSTNELFLNYENVLDKDLKSYINKLIHYAFINGLNFQDTPCEGSFCYNESQEIEDNNSTINLTNRRLYQVNNNRIFNIFNYTKLDREKINKLKNNNLRNLSEYSPKMGAISENDINSYVLDMQNILYYFNQTYLSREFKDINRFSNIFFDKINNTYLIKLERSIEMTALKFSTILTKDNYKILKDIMFKQFNEISFYIYNNSELIDNFKNGFNNILNDSSILLEGIFNLSYIRINEYYKMFYQLIQNEIKYLNDEDLNQSKNRLLSNNSKEEKDNDRGEAGNINDDHQKALNQYLEERKKEKEEKEKNNNNNKDNNNVVDEKKIVSVFSVIKNKEDTLKELKEQFLDNWNNKGFFKTDEEGRIWENVYTKKKIDIGVDVSFDLEKKQLNLMVNFCISLFKLKFDDKFIFPLKLCPYADLAISIIPSLESQICLGIGPNLDFKENKYSFDFDISGGASVGVTLDFGIFFFSVKSPIRFSFNVGLNGILGSGKVGVKLSIYFEDIFKLDLYYEFKAFEFTFYVMFKLTFKLELKFVDISFSFSFYIYKKLFGGFKYEFHKEKTYYLNNTKELKDKCEIKTTNRNKWEKRPKIKSNSCYQLL